jgi:hypothetical protein
MRIFTVLKNLFLILLVVGVVYMFANYAEPVKNMVFGMLHIPSSTVLGASSSRAGDFSKKVGSDIGSQVNNLEKQASNIRIGDIVGVLGRAQKIPQDIKAASDFIKQQVDNVTKKK